MMMSIVIGGFSHVFFLMGYNHQPEIIAGSTMVDIGKKQFIVAVPHSQTFQLGVTRSASYCASRVHVARRVRTMVRTIPTVNILK